MHISHLKDINQSKFSTMTKSDRTNAAGLPLLGKNAIVTGAARGIGAAIAYKLASDGANVGRVASPSPQTEILTPS